MTPDDLVEALLAEVDAGWQYDNFRPFPSPLPIPAPSAS